MSALRRRRVLVSFFTTILVAALAIADIVIDDFTIAQGPLSTFSSAATESADDSSIFGGERNLYVEATETSGGSADVAVTSGELTFLRNEFGGAVTQSKFEVWWDGDNDSTTFDADFLTPAVDLTAAGALNAFRLDMSSSTDDSIAFMLKVYSGSANHSAKMFVIPEPGGNVDLRFTDFQITGGSGANFAAVTAIHLSSFTSQSFVEFSAAIDSLSVISLPERVTRETGTDDFRISFAGEDGDGASTANPAIAGNGDGQALVVWHQIAKVNPTDADSENEIYGRLIDTETGAALSAPVMISDMGSDHPGSTYGVQNPDVVYNAEEEEYFVVWRGDDDAGSLADNEREIFGRRVNAAGTPVGDMIRISFMGTDGNTSTYGENPAVSWDPVNNVYLVVWEGSDATEPATIYGSLVDATGTPDPEFVISDAGPNDSTLRFAFEPDVAYGDGRFLVVWSGEPEADNAFDIFGQLVDATSPGNTADFQISDLGNSDTDTSYRANSPRVAFNPVAEEFLVVFSGDDESIGDDFSQIFGRRVTAADGTLPGSDFQISAQGQITHQRYQAIQPDVAWKAGTNTYLVVWRGDEALDNDLDVWARRITASGSGIDPEPFRISTMGPITGSSPDYFALSPAIDNSTAQPVVVWRGEDDIGVNNEIEIFGQRLTTNASAAESTITAAPTDRQVGESATITVQVKDGAGANVTSGGHAITLATTIGEIGAVTDNGDGTYTATIECDLPGLATITGTVDGDTIGDDAAVEFSAGPTDLDASTVTAEPTPVVADGATAATITVTLRDANGNSTGETDTVSLATTLGTLSAITNHGDGTFTATLTSTTTGTATITATVTGLGAVTDTASVTFTAGPTDLAQSTVTPAPTSVVADGSSSATITVELLDANGNATGTSDTVSLETTLGTLSAITNHGDGTFTATLTSTTTGSATITATVTGLGVVTDTATVTFTVGPATTLLVEAPATATGGTAFDVTVTARDSMGRTATGYTGTVSITSTAASATLPANYTFTAPDAGVHTFSVTLNSAGTITVTAKDTGTASITGNDAVAVKGNTTTALVSGDTSTLVGESVTFTATVSSPTTGTVTGNVTFKRNGTSIGTVAVSGGSAALTTSSLAAGTHSITAEYNGSTNFNTSTSNAVTQTVTLSSFGAPVVVSATATSTTQVAVSWSAVAGATGYRIYRSSLGSGFSLLTTVAGTAHNDSGLTATRTYVYKVSALNGAVESALSVADAATTLLFTDPSITTSTTAKKAHIEELRMAVNAMRAAAGLADAIFSDDPLTAGSSKIERLHVTELRTALDAARAALVLPALSYTDSTITAGTTTVKASHLTELRAGVQ